MARREYQDVQTYKRQPLLSFGQSLSREAHYMKGHQANMRANFGAESTKTDVGII